MPSPGRFALAAGALAGLTAVMLGAFGAHALRDRLAPDLSAIYQTAVQYQFWHALALLAIGLLQAQWQRSAALRWATACMAAGILLFCGSLYLLALTGVRQWGAVTPFGGTLWVLGWALLGYAVLRQRSSRA